MLQRDTKTTLFASLSNDALIAHVTNLAARARHATVELIASLAELDARRLYLGAGCSSLFTYCTRVLHLSEHAAYGRIEAARLARRVPEALQRLADGSLTLTAVCLLGPVLTEANAVELLEAARHKTKREVEQLVARVRPLPVVPASVRKVPELNQRQPLVCLTGEVRNGGTEGWVGTASAAAPDAATHASPALPPSTMPSAPTAPPRPPIVRPLSAETYKVQFTLTAAGHRRLRRAQDLLRHKIPNGDIAQVMAHALELLVEGLERRKLAAVDRPRRSPRRRTDTRHIPSDVRRDAWKRDGGQCAFVGKAGRCAEYGFLELHHVIPFAEGGQATVDNIQLRCRAHNQHEAELWLGVDRVRERSPVYGELGPDRVGRPSQAEARSCNSANAHAASWTRVVARYNPAGADRRSTPRKQRIAERRRPSPRCATASPTATSQASRRLLEVQRSA